MMTTIRRKEPIVAPTIVGVLLLLDPSDVGMSGLFGCFAIKSVIIQENNCSLNNTDHLRIILFSPICIRLLGCSECLM